jgi:uncharacterized protein YlxW (UPF0749 family)
MPESPTGPGRPERPERPEAPSSGRRRLLHALATPSRSQVVVAVLLGAVGFAGVTQIRETDEGAYAGLREQDLIDVLDGLAGTSQRTQAEIDRLLQTRDDLRSESTRRETALERTRQEVAALNVLAGLVPVTGPGVRVTLTEVTDEIEVSTFLDVIQEMRSVDAEAIQVNGQVRLVAQSWIEAGTGGIVVDGTLLEPPYVIDAIGDTAALEGAMVFPLGPRSVVEREGGELTVEVLPSLDIESVIDRVQPEFAEAD